jgi:glycosyltransferase involved in cell wall biosynthesis
MQQADCHGYRPVLACPAEGRLPDEARGLGYEVVPTRVDRMRHSLNPATLVRYAVTWRRESRRIERICREQDIRLLHAHSPVSALYAAPAARRLKIPLVVHMHDAQPPKFTYRWATRYASPLTARFVCCTQCVRTMVEGMGIPREKTSVIYYGLHPSFLGAKPDKSPEVTGDGPHIGLFGQVMAWKGQDVFLKAATRLAEKLPTAHFYIVGGLAFEDDRPYLERLEAMAAAPALKGRVTFTGFRPDVPRWMAAMDVVVHASVETEAFGLVIAEAMALNRRVVAADVGGPAEIIEDGVTGRLIPPAQPQALAEAILDLASRPANDGMVERAEASVRARFTPERYGEDLARLYSEVLSQNGRAQNRSARNGRAPR